MAKPSKSKRGRKSPNFLLERGLLAVAIGAVLLIGSMAVGDGHPVRAALSLAMSMPAWWAIGIGLVLVTVHGLKQFTHRPRSQSFQMASSQGRNSRLPASAIQALIDQVEFASFMADADGPTDLKTPSSTRKMRSETTQAPAPPPLNPWVPELFAALNAPQFEAVCEALFGQAGFETRAQRHNANGGLDIWLYSKRSSMPAAVVQCQHGNDQAIGKTELQAFLDVMVANNVKRGTYTTASGYTPEALGFAKANGINVLDSSSLMRLIAKRSPEQQQALLDAAAASFSTQTQSKSNRVA